MTTKQAYQPKVGDKVRVLVEESQYGTELDMSKPYYVRYERTALGGVAIWEREGERDRVVLTDQIEPWRDPAPSQPQLPQGHVLLRDPSIGDVEREYREARREAKVGELIKVVDWDSINFDKCAYPEVIAIRSGGTGVDAVGSRKGDEIKQWVRHDQYLVLEPTVIVWIYEGDDVYTRYQLAEAGRVAQVGEKVLVVPTEGKRHNLAEGSIADVTSAGLDLVWADGKSANHGGTVPQLLKPFEYRVLLPIPTVESENVASDDTPVDSNLDFTALLATANADMARHLEQARAIGHGEGYAEGLAMGKFDMEATLMPTVRELETQLAEAREELAKERENKKVPGTPITAEEQARMHAVMEACRALGKRNAERRAQKRMSRDEVVEMAKGEVDSIVKSVAEDGEEITFRVNREFRTVVAELRIQGEATRSAKAHATCAPDDVFNVHIGKVIAACRLAGSAVPAVYKNAPQPEKSQVGDVFASHDNSRCTWTITETHANGSVDFRVDQPTRARNAFSNQSWDERAYFIIDDSRDGYVYDAEKYRSYIAKQTKGGAAA